MTQFTKQIEILERVDQLVRLKSTGRPKELAKRLRVSEATVFRIIENMKSLNAPIKYDITVQSYIYTSEINFKFGFYEKLDNNTEKSISGGYSFGHLKIALAF